MTSPLKIQNENKILNINYNKQQQQQHTSPQKQIITNKENVLKIKNKLVSPLKLKFPDPFESDFDIKEIDNILCSINKSPKKKTIQESEEEKQLNGIEGEKHLEKKIKQELDFGSDFEFDFEDDFSSHEKAQYQV